MDNKNNIDRISYALGLSMGNNFRAWESRKSTFRTSQTALPLYSMASNPK